MNLPGADVSFTMQPEEAEAWLESRPFDVVVCADVAVLDAARRLRPLAARVQVVGADQGCPSTLREAHIVVGGLVDAGGLEAIIDRALGGPGLISFERLRKIIGTTDRLPALSATTVEFLKISEAPDVRLSDISKVLERDPAVAAKILQLANSVYFGLSRRVGTVERAVAFLGTGHIRSIVLAGEAWKLAKGGPEAEVARMRSVGLLSAQLVRTIGGPNAAEAATAAMLSNVGALLVLGRLPKEHVAIEELYKKQGGSRAAAEGEILGATLAQVGAHLLAFWRLPRATCEAVAFSRTPYPHPSRGMDVAAVTYLACGLAAEALGEETTALDPHWCAYMGVDRELVAWRQVAQQLAMAWPDV